MNVHGGLLSVLSVFRFMLSTVTNFVKYRPNLFQLEIWYNGLKKECGSKLMFVATSNVLLSLSTDK